MKKCINKVLLSFLLAGMLVQSAHAGLWNSIVTTKNNVLSSVSARGPQVADIRKSTEMGAQLVMCMGASVFSVLTAYKMVKWQYAAKQRKAFCKDLAEVAEKLKVEKARK